MNNSKTIFVKGQKVAVMKPTKTAITVEKGIESVDISKVIIWKDNPKDHASSVKQLSEIIKTRGQISPVIVWRKNNVCYKGNGTIAALKLLGMKKVDVRYVSFPSEAAAIAYGIADNKSGELSAWDSTVLSKFLSMEEVENTGFTTREIGFFNSVEVTVEKEPIIEKVLKAFKTFGKTSLNILNYACVEKGRLRITNLDVHIDAPVEAPDGLYDLRKYEHVRDFAFCKAEGDAKDFPESPAVTGTAQKIDLSDLEKFVPFASNELSRGVLQNVCFSKQGVFATDGIAGLIEKRMSPVEFSIFAASVKTLSVFGGLQAVCMNTGRLKAETPDGVTIVCKISEDPLPNIAKVIQKVEKWQSVDRGAFLGQVRKMLPLSDSLHFSKGKMQSKEIAAEVETEIEGRMNAAVLEKTLSVFSCDTIQIGKGLSTTLQFQFSDGKGTTALVMGLREIEKWPEAPVVFKAESPKAPEVMKKFTVTWKGFNLSVSCLKGLEPEVRDLFKM
jgi:ParB-like nuclease domain